MNRLAGQSDVPSGGIGLHLTEARLRLILIARVAGLVLLTTASLGGSPVKPESRESGFDRANALYEQGDYTNAALAYETLIKQSGNETTLYFNLGNAWFKAGAMGRAVAAYREGERLNPRDPSLRFNLTYTRKQILGDDARGLPLWQRLLAQLTLNEWTCVAAGFLWLLFLLLALREARARWRQPLLPYVLATAVGLALCAAALLLAHYLHSTTRPAVVVVPEAIVRFGPLAESQVSHQLRDGSEIVVIAEKKVSTGSAEQLWWHVRDHAGRTGWLRSDHALLIR